jgi:hypothetical protein
MVADFYGTVGFDEETVAFIKAIEFVKKRHRIFYKEISEKIGLTKEQGEQIRAGRRKASNEDISNLIKQYPDSLSFFDKLYKNTEKDNQTLHEPMVTQFYGKQETHPYHELIETQRKLIAKLEAELEEVKGKLKEVEGQNKVLVEIVSQRK